MRNYLDLLSRILNEGEDRDGRNGKTRALFALQFRHDLRNGFPAVTTKKLAFKSVVGELLWFLSGSTDDNKLKELSGIASEKNSIWSANARDFEEKSKAAYKGDLGRIYGHNWRHWGAKRTFITQPKPKLRSDLKATYCGVANGDGREGHPLKTTWSGMIDRCYDENSVSYKYYGARGVFVCDRWLEFRVFAEDIALLAGYEDKLKNPEEFVLDKDEKGGFQYSPSTCQWISCARNCELKSSKIYTVKRIEDGEIFIFSNANAFCEDMGIESSNFYDLWTGNKNAKRRSGFRLVSVEDKNDGIDQIAQLVKRLREDPFSRYHLVTAWNPSDISAMALPACHVMFQLFAHTDGGLSLSMIQRSCDMFLGVPFNIASYALLLSMISHVTSRYPRELVITFQDAHIYHEHFEPVTVQLLRIPHALSTLKLDPAVKELTQFEMRHIVLDDYVHDDPIKARMIV